MREVRNVFNLLVLGATGFVGRGVCERLVERSGAAGGRIRVATRRPTRARHLQLLPTVELAVGDVHDDATLDWMLRDCDAVINLVAILHGSEAEFERVHVRLPERLADACRRTGVRRVLHISALGAATDAPSRYLRSKARGEAALRAAGLDVTILRPSVIFGERDRFLNLFALLQTVLPVLPLASASARFQPVWVDDVATAVARCLDDPTTVGTTIECVGPRVYTLRELVEATGEWSGTRRPVLPLPAPLGRLQALAMELLPGRTLMSRDNVDSMRVASVASGRLPGLERVGIEPTPLEAIAPRYLGHVSGEKRLEAWRARARRN
jgi:NADH dehydrogenase